jgi:hypothetical protein
VEYWWNRIAQPKFENNAEFDVPIEIHSFSEPLVVHLISYIKLTNED